MGLDDTLSSREEIERSLKAKISKVAHDWGLQINSIEILEITPTAVVQAAMHQQLSAERIRRAAIVSADGQREKTKLEAEGECQSAIAISTGEKQVTITRAQGQADARRLVARAEADAVRIVAAALQEYGVDPTQYIIGMKYIDAITSMACSAANRLIYFPLQTDIAGALSAVSGPSK
jgi:regulator of protease activity HflC (stomatin/prohibitin superfamily)